MMAYVQVMTPEEQQAMLAEAQARAQAAQPAPSAAVPAEPTRIPAMAGAAAPALAAGVDRADPGTWGSSGRNDPCPGGSGKMYQQSLGRV
jgi:uncharacterized protein YecA (UPF0149 family)